MIEAARASDNGLFWRQPFVFTDARGDSLAEPRLPR
jgi:hypothetical protein